MAKFLFCVPRYHTNMVPWVRVLKQAGHEVAVHVTTLGPTENHSDLQPYLQEPSTLSRFLIRHTTEDSRQSLWATPKFGKYWEIMKRENPEVVIVRGVTRCFSRLAALIALLQGRRLVIYDQEDVWPKAYSTWIRRAVFRLIGIPHVTSRLAVEDSGRDRLGSALPLPFGNAFVRDRSPPRPNGAPPLSDDVNEKKSDAAPRLLMVAKYRLRKDHATLLRAAARIAGDYAFTLTFCGEEINVADKEFCENLRRLATELGLQSRLEFRNNTPHDRMPELYSAHEIFILPAQQEPAAISPIEAAWSGAAVILARDSGTRGYIPPGRDFDFTPGDSQDLARALAQMLSNREHLEMQCRICRHYIESHAGHDLILRRFTALLPRPTPFSDSDLRE